MSIPDEIWTRPPARLDLAGDEVHVWCACLDRPAWCIQQLARTLSADETARADRLRFEHDRRRFIVTRGVLRTLLGRYLHVEPRQVQFRYGPRGKPALAGNHSMETLHFNVSHSHELALYAITRSREIGIDLEYVRPVDDIERIAARYFSRQENEALQALPEGIRLEAFYTCWTRKEAFIKATGNGLSQPLDRFTVSLVPGEAARLLHMAGDPQEAARWILRELRPAAGYVAAFATPGNDLRLTCWQWEGCGQGEYGSMSPPSIPHLLAAQAEHAPEAIAVLAPDRVPLTYGRLVEQITSIISRLNELGIGRNDRLAIVLPNGPEMALAFLSIASAATSAPLNPAYRASEFDFYLSDLNARAVVVMEGDDSPARTVALARGIPVIDIVPSLQGPAGLFALRGEAGQLVAPPGPAQPDDVALVLHTSGTTSRPKMVPLTHRNLCASAESIRRSLQLTDHDRCLNVMPLFHIHGLVAALLASLSAGASVVCTPGFYAPQFFSWLEAHKPTWYTAVPTMQQAILARADANRDVIARAHLRFIRSCSASLAPQLMAALESTFNVPVIEAYGMTEASHQMTSSPLPPAVRKPGSVGIAAGPEVAIMAEDGAELLPAGQIGEIVIRGPNVMHGYATNPEANAKAFTGGWFRTGDQGHMDDEGYLTITGRLKEIINRGGEKISPREVDEVLLDHPAVAQAVTFAMPSADLGEDVAAAVVLTEPNVSEKELRRYAWLHLAPFKVPRRIVIVDEIPKGPTGKIQRIGLAERLGLTAEPTAPDPAPDTFVPPGNEIEKLLAQMFCEVLGLPDVSVHQRFLDLGGDSILATLLVDRLCQTFDINLTLLDLFDAPTVAEQAVVIEGLLLGEIEALSDEEVERLVAGQTGRAAETGWREP